MDSLLLTVVMFYVNSLLFVNKIYFMLMVVFYKTIQMSYHTCKKVVKNMLYSNLFTQRNGQVTL